MIGEKIEQVAQDDARVGRDRHRGLIQPNAQGSERRQVDVNGCAGLPRAEVRGVPGVTRSGGRRGKDYTSERGMRGLLEREVRRRSEAQDFTPMLSHASSSARGTGDLPGCSASRRGRTSRTACADERGRKAGSRGVVVRSLRHSGKITARWPAPLPLKVAQVPSREGRECGRKQAKGQNESDPRSASPPKGRLAHDVVTELTAGMRHSKAESRGPWSRLFYET